MPSPFSFLARVIGLVLIASPSFPTPEPTASWQTSGPPLYQVNAVATDPAQDTAVYAAASIYSASQSALFRSSDGGRTWDPLVEAPHGEFYSEIMVDPHSPQRIYAGTQGNGGVMNLYRSIDAGVTWSMTGTISPSCTLSFAPGSAPGVVLTACGLKLLRSQDGGATWTELTTPFSESVRLTPGPGGILLAYGATSILRSANDGGSWTPVAGAPAECPSILALDVDPGDANVLVIGTGKLGGTGFLCGGVFRSADGGKTWGANGVPGVYMTDVVIDSRSPDILFASASYLAGILPRGGVFQSRDGGATWTNLRLPANGAVRLALSASGRLLHAATSIGVFDRGFRKTSRLSPRP
jgi:photosystem II stability/assembly factor-like uncharacterized protein